MPYYPLTSDEWLSATSALRFAEIKVLYYLRTLDPFCDRELEIAVSDLATVLNIHKGTVSKALRKLADLGWFEFFEIQTVRLKLSSRPPMLPTGVASCPEAEQVACRQPATPVGNIEKIESSPGKGFSDRQNTNNRSTLLNNNGAERTENDQRGIGTLIGAIEAIGIRANKSIRAEVFKLTQELDFAAAFKRVQLAIESVQEQIERGNAENPGGLLVIALRRKFTPNNDGYRKQAAPPAAAPPAPPPGATSPAPPPGATSPAPPPGATSPAPPPVAPPIPDADQLERTFDQLLIEGQRNRVLERLQQLVEEGYGAEVRDLIRLRRDWRFKLRNGQKIVDVS